MLFRVACLPGGQSARDSPLSGSPTRSVWSASLRSPLSGWLTHDVIQRKSAKRSVLQCDSIHMLNPSKVIKQNLWAVLVVTLFCYRSIRSFIFDSSLQIWWQLVSRPNEMITCISHQRNFGKSVKIAVRISSAFAPSRFCVYQCNLWLNFRTPTLTLI